MTPIAKDSTQKMQTLSECMAKAREDGYTEDFQVGISGLTTVKGSFYPPHKVSITNFYRFEGYSDPADNSILYLIETTDHTKGILIDAYDTYADARVSNFIRQVDSIQKKHSNRGLHLMESLKNIFRKN